MSEQSVPTNMAVAEAFDKLAQALIAHAAALSSFAGMYKGAASSPAPAGADAAAAPATAGKGSKKKDAAAAAPGATTAETQAFAVAWIKEGASEAAQLAIKNQVLSIVNKYGAQKIADLPATALGPVLAELTAAKAGGAAAPSVIDI